MKFVLSEEDGWRLALTLFFFFTIWFGAIIGLGRDCFGFWTYCVPYVSGCLWMYLWLMVKKENV